jgi:CheY-like chemotaxis protein
MILLIDDEEIQIQSVQSLLERLGYVVSGKTNTLKSRGVFRAKPDAFDPVITSGEMSERILEALRKNF